MVLPWLVGYTKRPTIVRYGLTHLRALQELALSRSVLCFTSEQAFFCCVHGIVAESFSTGNDRCGSLPILTVHSMKTCGILHRTDDTPVPRTLHDIVQRFRAVFLPLLTVYCEKRLTFESDRLYAFLGIINAEACILGPFHWGLPTALFVRALLLYRIADINLNPQPNFPSWSWVSWTFPSIGWIFDALDSVRPLVHIYICNKQSQLQLLFGPRDERAGIEGYCTEAINMYNKITNLEPLPVLPCIDRAPPLVVSAENISHILVFWSHVARMNVTGLNVSKATKEWCCQHNDGMCDVALLEFEYYKPPIVQFSCSGIIIQRNRGFARVIGDIKQVSIQVWKQGNPQLELLLLE
jgi:hypothetical protein